jgi:hypothetical protein
MAAMYDSQMDPAVLLQRVLDYAIRSVCSGCCCLLPLVCVSGPACISVFAACLAHLLLSRVCLVLPCDHRLTALRGEDGCRVLCHLFSLR